LRPLLETVVLVASAPSSEGSISADAPCIVPLVAEPPKPASKVLAFLARVRLSHASILRFDARTDARLILIARLGHACPRSWPLSACVSANHVTGRQFGSGS